MTETELFSNEAFFALNYTTPVEITQAVLLKHHRFLLVATVTAQQVTAADVHGRAVAYASPRPQGASFSICQAKIGRVIRVDQVLLVRRLYALPNRNQGLAVVATHHFESAVEAVQKSFPHLTEIRHFPPTRSQGARPRQSVTFTFCPHVELHCLGWKTQRGGSYRAQRSIKTLSLTHTYISIFV